MKDVQIATLTKQLADKDRSLAKKDENLHLLVALARVVQGNLSAANVTDKTADWCLRKADILKWNKHYPRELHTETPMWGLVHCKSTVHSEGAIIIFKVQFLSWGDCFKSVAFTGKLQVLNTATGDVLKMREFHETFGDVGISIDIQDMSDDVQMILMVDEIKPTQLSNPQAFFDSTSASS